MIWTWSEKPWAPLSVMFIYNIIQYLQMALRTKQTKLKIEIKLNYKNNNKKNNCFVASHLVKPKKASASFDGDSFSALFCLLKNEFHSVWKQKTDHQVCFILLQKWREYRITPKIVQYRKTAKTNEWTFSHATSIKHGRYTLKCVAMLSLGIMHFVKN